MGVMVGTKLRRLSDEEYHLYVHDCPACGQRHYIPTGDVPEGPSWTFNGDPQKPSFTPSMNIDKGRCHYYLTEGKLIYTKDCRHALAGHTVDLPDLKGY